jgi:hypothetical protein
MGAQADVLVGVVGPCAAGKSTLIAGLAALGVPARHIAQEHSYVPDMWLRLTHPGFLIYLDVSYEISRMRRKLDWTEQDYLEQCRRLAHARRFANLYLNTDPMTPAEVLSAVLDRLRT